jgi:hypothetical protein
MTARPGGRRLTAGRAARMVVALALTVGTGAVAVRSAAAVTAQPVYAVLTAAHSRADRAAAVPQIPQHPYRAVCPQPPRPGVMACLALVRTDVKPHKGLFRRGVTAQAEPPGYGPSDLQSAYDLPSSAAGSGATVAIVDAGDNPTAEADLAVYRAQYGLPPCTTASGCFEKVNQEGQRGHYPPEICSPFTGGCWPIEESLDVDMVSAVCPNCHIILVEANSATIADLGAAEDEAVALGARYVSNSWGAAEDQAGSSELRYDKYFDHPGTVITAAAGDDGYGVSYPSASQYVTSVGGTTLMRDSSVPRGWAESVWPGTGSGCSAYEPQPSWQAGITRGCAKRATADVAADANPDTGVAMYDTLEGGWLEVGGTSVATPVIASSYALAGLPAAGTYPASYVYAHYSADPSAFNDITSGANGTCTPSVLCTGGPGWNGPTGLGTPHGVTGFAYAKLGSITGAVTDHSTGDPVAGATVSVSGASVTTTSTGSYTLSGIPAGSVTVRVSAYGYHRTSR